MTALAAARMGDVVGHTAAAKGGWLGALVGAAVGAVLVAGLVLGTALTGGLLAVAIGAAVVGSVSAGALRGIKVGSDYEGGSEQIGSGSGNVFIESSNAARAGEDTVKHGKKKVAQGSRTVFVNGKMLARKTDKAECGGKITKAASTVFVGGDTGQAAGTKIDEEVPAWVMTALNVGVYASAAVGAAIAIPAVGLGAAIVEGGALFGIGKGLEIGGGKLGHAITGTERGALWGEAIGGTAGDLVSLGAPKLRIGERVGGRVPWLAWGKGGGGAAPSAGEAGETGETGEAGEKGETGEAGAKGEETPDAMGAEKAEPPPPPKAKCPTCDPEVKPQLLLEGPKKMLLLEGPKPSAAEQASRWQGSDPYPGVDPWENVVLPKGTIVARGEPGPAGIAKGKFFTTPEEVAKANGDSPALFQGLQVKPHPELGYYPKVRMYQLTQDTPAATSVTSANPQFGDGGARQYYIPEGNMEPVGEVDMSQ